MNDEISSKENRRKFRTLKQRELAERRAAVSQRYKEGWTLEAIAKDMGTSTTTAWEDVQGLLAKWGRTAGINISAHIATEYAKINALEAEAWAAYENSKKSRRVASARKVVTPVRNDDGTTRQVEITMASATEFHPAAGDPRFFNIILQCISQRIKLFGLANCANGKLDQEKTHQPQTLTEFVAMHYKREEERSGNGTAAKAARPATVELDPNRLP